MNIETTLDALCANSVTVLTTKVFVDNGEEYRIAPHAKAYYNSAQDREKLKADIPEQYYNAVMLVWGDEPTVFPEIDEDEIEE